MIVIGIWIKCLGLESVWRSFWWIFDTISLLFWNMYMSKANLACVKSFVSDVQKRKEKKSLYVLLMNPKIISAKSTSVWNAIWIIDVNNLMWYLTQLWLMNFKNWLKYLLQYTEHMLLIQMLNLTVVLSYLFANATANSIFLERFNSNFSKERKLSSTLCSFFM